MKRVFPFLVVLIACGRSDPTPTPSAAGSASALEVLPVVAKPLDTTALLEGELAPFERVAIYARANGFIGQVLVDRGSHVKQGQLLATVVAPELAAQRAEAEAKLAGDKGTFDRLSAAAQTPGAVAGQEVETARATLDADRAHVNALRAMEQYLTITAPFDGVVTERGMHPGALVGPQAGEKSTPLVRIEQLSTLRLTVGVPESLVASITENATASFTVASYPGVKFSGATKRVAGSIDSRTRTMPVELDVDNADGRLAPGMFASVVWPVKRPAPSLFVPSSAIAQSTERTFVVRVKDGVAEQVPVQRGIVQGDLVEVFGALQAGDVVAKRAAEDLRTGTAVRTKL